MMEPQYARVWVFALCNRLYLSFLPGAKSQALLRLGETMTSPEAEPRMVQFPSHSGSQTWAGMQRTVYGEAIGSYMKQK